MRLPIVILLFFFVEVLTAREVIDFTSNWTFRKGDFSGAIQPDFNDSDWRSVNLPHDWGVEGSFDVDGESSTGKLPWRGQGWYRKSFAVDDAMEEKRIYLLFDGIMAFPKIYINGKLAGQWDYGYNSFYLDVTDLINTGEENLIVVHVDTRKHKSRWYPGAGIYRKIQMVVTAPVHVPIWGTYVTTPKVAETNADVRSVIELKNSLPDPQMARVEYRIINPENQIILSEETAITIAADTTEKLEFWNNLFRPRRWDVDHPHLYQILAIVKVDGKIVDSIRTDFGIRDFKFTADDGFHLNGRRLQIKGVNLHHGHGPLGAAFYTRAMERQLEIMKAMGCNAVRTSHNMPAPELLDLCDKMGLIVIDEAFDKLDEHMDLLPGQDFFEFTERQLHNFIKRDRNHPAIVLWSVANEERGLQANQPGSIEKLNALVNYVRRYDPTRPVTLVTDNFSSVIEWGLYDYFDIHSYNYGRRYREARRERPDMPTLIAESASTLSTRGFYELPLPKEKTDFTDALQVSSYDLNAPYWAEPVDYDFYWQELDRFVAGEFIWTGFDYLGEPTPYTDVPTGEGYSSRSSYFGVVDLVGIPKDRFYLYKSHWLPDDTTVHMLPHWNWKDTDSVPVFVYTNGDKAELFLNGRSMGFQYKQPESENPLERYRLMWKNIPYEPGQLRVVAYKEAAIIGEDLVKTASAPIELRLNSDRDTLHSDGKDLAYLEVLAADVAGNFCPLADQSVTVIIDGPAQIAGVGNGNPQSFKPFQRQNIELFYGKAMIIVRTIKQESGTVKITVSSNGLKSATTSLIVKQTN